jgi:hypothetical protein
VTSPDRDIRDVGRDWEPASPPEPLVVPQSERPPVPEERPREEEPPPVPYIHVAEYVKVRSLGQVFDFMKLSMRVYRHAHEHEGFVAGGIKSKWCVRKFWSYTVWEDRDAMMRFVNSGPHAEAARRIQHFAAPGSCYVEWVSEQPPDWPEALQRLERPTRYFVGPAFEDYR